MSPEVVVYFLSEYNWERGSLCKIRKGNRSMIIAATYPPGPQTFFTLPVEKCAFLEERVCIVWETWKGRNGRGAYRVERELYEDLRLPPNEIARQHLGHGRVTESSYGILSR